MIELSDEILRVIHDASAAADPREACGVIRGKRRHLEAIALTNYDRRVKKVAMRAAEVYALESDGWAIQAIWHSHVRQTLEPSDTDLLQCKKSGVPWLIYGYPNRRTKWISPEQHLELPLIGREFHHGVVDCYTLIRDYYRSVLDVDLPDFVREDDWWMRGGNVYLENLEAAGFYPIERKDIEREDLRQHDVLLMRMAPTGVRLKYPSHGAVYVGASKIRQHLQGRRSEMVFLSPYYWNRTTHIARFKAFAE